MDGVTRREARKPGRNLLVVRLLAGYTIELAHNGHLLLDSLLKLSHEGGD